MRLFAFFFVLAAIGVPVCGFLLSQRAQEAGTKLVAKDKAIVEAKDEVEALEAKQDFYVAEVKAKDQRIGSLEKSIRTMASPNEAAFARVKELEASKSQLETEMADLRKQVETLDAAIRVIVKHRPEIWNEIEKIDPEEGKRLRAAFDRMRLRRPDLRTTGRGIG